MTFDLSGHSHSTEGRLCGDKREDDGHVSMEGKLGEMHLPRQRT